jgi:hypothetical protein
MVASMLTLLYNMQWPVRILHIGRATVQRLIKRTHSGNRKVNKANSSVQVQDLQQQPQQQRTAGAVGPESTAHA